MPAEATIVEKPSKEARIHRRNGLLSGLKVRDSKNNIQLDLIVKTSKKEVFAMSTLVADLTINELEQIIENAVERKIFQLFDEDRDKSIKPEIINRLRQQKSSIDNGNFGRSFDDVVNELGLGNV